MFDKWATINDSVASAQGILEDMEGDKVLSEVERTPVVFFKTEAKEIYP